MPRCDATIMLFSDKKQKRAGAYFRGNAPDVIALLSAAGMDDPDFGKIIIHAAFTIINEEKRKAEEMPDEV